MVRTRFRSRFFKCSFGRILQLGAYPSRQLQVLRDMAGRYVNEDTVESERPLKVCAEARASSSIFSQPLACGRLAGNACGTSTSIPSCLQSWGLMKSSVVSKS